MDLFFSEKKRSASERGFTLIELLTVVAIVGVLAAIAIPRFIRYQERSVRAGMTADARNGATALEAYFVDQGFYPDPSEVSDIGPGPATGSWGGVSVKASRGSTLKVPSITASTYQIVVANPGSGDGDLTMDSAGTCSFATTPC